MNNRQKSVVLISPKSYVGGSRSHYPQYTESLGIAYLASILRKHGYHVQLVDMNMGTDDLYDVVRLVKRTKNLILVGLSANSRITFLNIITLCSWLRDHNVTQHITLGGHFATSVSKDILEEFAFVDSVVRGQGESTLLELVSSLVTGTPLFRIEGLTFRHNGQIVENPARCAFIDLDNLSFPERYNAHRIVLAEETLQIASSRGCQGSCSFCSLHTVGDVWQPRSPVNIVDEIEFLVNKYNARMIRFVDADFFGCCKEGLERAVQISDEIIRRKLKVSFKILCRVDDINEGVLRKMQLAGLSKVSVGIESYNQRQLDFYNKRISVNDIRRAVSTIRKLGLRATFSFIMFDPYSTIKEIETNLHFIKEHSDFFKHRRLTSRLRPDVGTQILEELRDNNLCIKHYFHEYAIRFKEPAIQLLWDIIDVYNKRYEFINIKLSSILDTYKMCISLRNEMGRKQAKDQHVEILLKNLRSQLFRTWTQVLEFGIIMAKEHSHLRQVRCLFPQENTTNFEETVSILGQIDRALIMGVKGTR